MHTMTFPDIAAWKNNPRLVSGRANQNPLLPSEQGIPVGVRNLQITTKHIKVNGTTMNQVTLNHIVDPTDTTHASTNVYATGLYGSSTPTQISSATKSPHVIVLPITKEGVSFTVQSVGKDGSTLPLSQSPTKAIKLN